MLHHDQMRIALLAAIVNKNPNNICIKPKWMGTCAPFPSYQTVKGNKLSYDVSNLFAPEAYSMDISAHPSTHQSIICSANELNEMCKGETGSDVYYRTATMLLERIASTEDKSILKALDDGIMNEDPFAVDGSMFFSNVPKRVGNLQPFRNHFEGELNAKTVQDLITESMKIKCDDGTDFKVRMNTLIVAPESFAAAVQATQLENIVYSDKDGTTKIGMNWVAVSKLIHQIITLPGMHPRTWYLCESFNDRREVGALSLIVNPTFEFDSDMWEIRKRVGVAYGLSPLIMRCDAPDPNIRQQLEAFLAGRDLGVTAAELESYFLST